MNLQTPTFFFNILQALCVYKANIYKIAKHVVKSSSQCDDSMWADDGELAMNDSGSGAPFKESVGGIRSADQHYGEAVPDCQGLHVR